RIACSLHWREPARTAGRPRFEFGPTARRFSEDAAMVWRLALRRTASPLFCRILICGFFRYLKRQPPDRRSRLQIQTAHMIGKSLRSYRIEAKLGAGGMGVVYKAVDSRLGRTAAIKIRSSGVLNTERERLFAKEAKADSSLNQPTIVRIYDVDAREIDEKPVQYIAMEYVP